MNAKEIVIISGKGGTGKTTITSSFVWLMHKHGEKFVIADADVDAADMHILLEPKIEYEEEFVGKSVAVIDDAECTSCDICRQLCRFDAIDIVDDTYRVNPFKCDGCTLCAIACPVKAIEMVPQVVGKWFLSSTKFGPMVHARLIPGAENSGNLVTMVKHQAHLISEKENIPYILVDGPPGIGCPVTSSISGASFVAIVVEPSFSAIHDMERATDTALHFGVPHGIIINKSGINPENEEQIKEFTKKRGIPFLGSVPFSMCVIDALVNKKIAASACSEVERKVEDIFSRILEVVNEKP